MSLDKTFKNFNLIKNRYSLIIMKYKNIYWQNNWKDLNLNNKKLCYINKLFKQVKNKKIVYLKFVKLKKIIKIKKKTF